MTDWSRLEARVYGREDMCPECIALAVDGWYVGYNCLIKKVNYSRPHTRLSHGHHCQAQVTASINTGGFIRNYKKYQLIVQTKRVK